VGVLVIAGHPHVRTVSVVGGPFCGYVMLYDESGTFVGLRITGVDRATGLDELREPKPTEMLRAKSIDPTTMTVCGLNGENPARYSHVELDTGVTQWQHVPQVLD
jgi:hypothetical protein